MARLKAPVVVSANCLLAGHVLYLNKNQEWVKTLASAYPFENLEEANAVAAKATDPGRVIGIELVGVALEGAQAVPRHYREAIRAKGPGAYVFPRQRERLMYQYSEFDKAFLKERVAQYRDQVSRRLAGALTEEEFKPLRLMNGVYLQLHAYMLRVAIPYGTLSAAQMRGLADISERWDKGYGHFTTRQNIQFNWPRLVDTPDILEALAELDMHAIQTSGNTVRNVTTDHFAGAALDEVADPRPYAEWIRQWSTDHPEFQFLPRKFKIAISAGAEDRAVIRAHDIGLSMVRGSLVRPLTYSLVVVWGGPPSWAGSYFLVYP